MAIPTVAQVALDAAIHLGDSGQEQMTEAVLLPFYGQAYREMCDVGVRWNLPMSERTATYTMAANTTSLTPATAGIADMGEPTKLWERLSSGDKWSPMMPKDELPQYPQQALNRFWNWEGDTFYFIGSTGQTLLKIEYLASGAPPATGSIGIDNSRNFLGFRTAGLAAAAYNMDGRAKELNYEALGPSMQADGTGGALRGLMLSMLKEKQNVRKAPGTFRPRRNTFTRWW